MDFFNSTIDRVGHGNVILGAIHGNLWNIELLLLSWRSSHSELNRKTSFDSAAVWLLLWSSGCRHDSGSRSCFCFRLWLHFFPPFRVYQWVQWLTLFKLWGCFRFLHILDIDLLQWFLFSKRRSRYLRLGEIEVYILTMGRLGSTHTSIINRTISFSPSRWCLHHRWELTLVISKYPGFLAPGSHLVHIHCLRSKTSIPCILPWYRRAWIV